MTDNYNLLDELTASFGKAVVTNDPVELQQVLIDGQLPQVLARPGTTEQAAEILKYAHAHDLKVAVRGGGTRTGLGNPIERLDLVLSTERLNAVTEYSRPDLMVGVQAGVKLTVLEDELEKNGQFLPVESAATRSGATIGGAIATNGSGPLRLFYGPARDWLIGVKFVLADGSLAKGGGRVVKNVAGFDMMKLFIGSLGTLGLIHEMNFKLMPLPGASATLATSFETAKLAGEVALKTIEAGIFPAALTILDRAGATALDLPGHEATLLIEVRNTGQAVERQVNEISRLCREAGGPAPQRMSDRAEQKKLWRAVTDFGYRELPENSLTLKVSTLPDQSTAMLTYAQHLAANHNLELQALAHVGHGLSWLTAQYGDEREALKVITELTAWVEARKGSVAVEKVPLSLKKQLPDVWGTALSAGELKLMRGVKEKLDPGNILNPGRFAGKL